MGAACRVQLDLVLGRLEQCSDERTTMTAHSATPVPPPDADGGRARRARGAALLLGAVLIVVLIRSGTLSFS